MLAIEAISKVIDKFPRSRHHSAPHLARRLGWFSIGLGLIEIAAPHKLSRFLGWRGGDSLVAFFGLREIGTGVAILSARNPEPFIWGRVAGDTLDLAALGVGLMASRRKPIALLALSSVAMVTMIDLICAQTLTADSAGRQGRTPDYSKRTGMPKQPAQMRGAAAKDFKTPSGMRAAPAQAEALH